MDAFLKKALYEWTYNTIKSNPKRFGGDNSNALIMKEYSIQNYSDERVSNLSKGYFSILSTVSRIKNKLLVANPHFDYRTKYKPRSKKASE